MTRALQILFDLPYMLINAGFKKGYMGFWYSF